MWPYKVRGPPWEKICLIFRKVNIQQITMMWFFQCTNRSVSLNKLFCMLTNAGCLSNKFNELMSVIDSCDTYPHLIGVCEIKPKYFTLRILLQNFPCLVIFCSNLISTPIIGEEYTYILATILMQHQLFSVMNVANLSGSLFLWQEKNNYLLDVFITAPPISVTLIIPDYSICSS